MIAPAKRGVPVLLHVFAVEIISIHAPVWGRAGIYAAMVSSDAISIHAPVWGRAFFSSGLSIHSLRISIHAPVWGRAVRVSCRCLQFFISIHAPVWGRAGATEPAGNAGRHFNSRPRVGAGR